MSYGISITNPSGQLAFTDERITPWFQGKLTKGAVPSSYYTDGSYRVYKQAYTFPSYVGGRQYIFAIALPDSVSSDQWYTPSVEQSSEWGSNGGFYIAAPTATLPANLVAPDVYAFCITHHAQSSETYGMRLYAANGTDIVFDSGNRPLMAVSMANVGLQSVSVAIASMPTKPAFLFYTWARERAVRRGIQQACDIYQLAGFFKRTGTNIIGTTREYSTEFLDLPLNFSETFGSVEVQPVPVINAANYD